MSSRHDHKRRDRSWERDERDRDRDRPAYRGGRRSRSRSPPRRDDRDRRVPDRRDRYGRDRDDDRRERRDDRRDDRRRDDRERRDHDRDSRREPPPDKERSRNDRDRDDRLAERAVEHDSKPSTGSQRGDRQQSSADREASGSRPRQDSEVPTDGVEEGEAMDATNDDDTAIMAMMGLSGFGSTKGKHVEGNQEGAVNVKKMRTWRQYMNRRGGFNRPLDKIK